MFNKTLHIESLFDKNLIENLLIEDLFFKILLIQTEVLLICNIINKGRVIDNDSD